MRRAPSLLLLPLLLAACTAPSKEETAPSGQVSSAILNGRPSGDDENAAVYIETVSVDETGATNTLRCSGRIIAPGLVVTARHCLLKRRSVNVRCNPDGSPVDVTDSVDVTVEPPEATTIFIGAQKSTARKVGVKEVFTELEVSVCRSDIAYVVLTEPGLDTRTPIRKAAPRLIDTVSITGWGYTSDEQVAQKVLPDTRSTIERPINQLGPNGVPSDSFAIGGGSVCLGDSGAAALAEGALLGVYSRIDNPDQCSLEVNRNIFVWPGAHVALANIAYKAIGETPWFEGERPPWLAKAGAPCARDEECSSSLCDVASSTCAAPCGASGLACPAGKSCNAEQVCVDPAPAPPPSNDGCATSRAETSPASALLVGIAVAAAVRRRRRSRY